jgi:sugar/nucleoside kinase (ribokinase family)
VPSLPRSRPTVRRATGRRPKIVVVGDLVLDAVLEPSRPIEHGTDVPGSVLLRAGGSASNTARWLARLGGRSVLVTAVGRDPIGRALVEAVKRDGVAARVVRVPGRTSGRIGVIVGPGGERSFVADRRAADALRPDDLRASWFKGADAVHLPAYSLLGEPLGSAGRRSIEIAGQVGAIVSLDLSSIGPLLARGRRAAVDLVRSVGADLLFATAAETEALLGRYAVEGLLDYAPLAIVKRGAAGSTILSRDLPPQDVAASPIQARDSTGAGDAFDAGFLVAWLTARRQGRSAPSSLHRAALAGHRAAARHLTGPRPELTLG